jgi:competence protein ComEC
MLRVKFINVGYGESILIEELREGRIFTMLVDGGRPFEGYHRGEYEERPGRVPAARYLEESGIEALDLLVMTHFHIDHVGGLPELLRRIPVGEFWTNYTVDRAPPELPPSPSADCSVEAREVHQSLGHCADISAILRRQGKEQREMRRDDFGIRLTQDLTMKMYGISDGLYRNIEGLIEMIYDGSLKSRVAGLAALDRLLNATCLTFKLSYAGRGVLFTADVPSGRWDDLIGAGHSLRSDILKFPHHGHEDGISGRLATAIDPRHVVFCVSENNPYGCPEPAVYGYFPEGTRFYATGAVELPPGGDAAAPHRAVIFEIGDDSRIKSWLEYD